MIKDNFSNNLTKELQTDKEKVEERKSNSLAYNSIQQFKPGIILEEIGGEYRITQFGKTNSGGIKIIREYGLTKK